MFLSFYLSLEQKLKAFVLRLPPLRFSSTKKGLGVKQKRRVYTPRLFPAIVWPKLNLCLPLKISFYFFNFISCRLLLGSLTVKFNSKIPSK
jgi:hypothetical protein